MKKILFCTLLLCSLISCEKGSNNSDEPKIPIASITIDPTKATLKVGETKDLAVTVTPDGANPKSIVWSTENERVAKVDENGKITAVGYGVTNISASAGDVTESVKEIVSKPTRKYTLVWQDEFNGSKLDESAWELRTGPNVNNEKQYYKKENATVSGGNLIITAKKEQVGTFNYTSARLHCKKSFTYGKFEARISFPKGGGNWAAFWMMPKEDAYGRWPNSGEIDIVEHVGNNPKSVITTVHTKLKNGTGKPSGAETYTTLKDNVEENFHVYGIEWVESEYNGNGRIDFYFDGTPVFSVSEQDYKSGNVGQWPFNMDFYMILNLAIGGNMGGAIDDSAFPMQMKVDWVKVYSISYE